MNNEIKKPSCAKCLYCLPDPERKRVFCRRYPPQLICVPNFNTITQKPDTLMISILPDCLPDPMYCGEYKADMDLTCVK